MAETRASIERLAAMDADSTVPTPELFAEWLEFARDGSTIRTMFEWLISAEPPVGDLVARVSALAADDANDEFALIRNLAGHYPGDPGVLIALMLNHVTLTKGEALFLAAGNIHAYLRGVGIELMASSDNVLRGGLTPKHVDVPELLSVLDFTASPVPHLRPEPLGATTTEFRPPVRDFQLTVIEGASTIPVPSAAILLCSEGEFTIRGATGSVSLSRGDSVFVTAEEDTLTVDGAGQMFMAATQ
jgi:mannose-6-phosphate isomerase